MRLMALAAFASALIVGAASAQPSGSSALGQFEPTGESSNCISMASADIRAIDDSTFLFRAGGGYYVNRARGTCDGAGSTSSRIDLKVFGSSLCSGEIIKIVDSGTGMFKSSCSLGVFEKLRRKPGAGGSAQ